MDARVPTSASLISVVPFQPMGEALRLLVVGSWGSVAQDQDLSRRHTPIIQDIVQTTPPLSSLLRLPPSLPQLFPAPSASGLGDLRSGSAVPPKAVAIRACCTAQEREGDTYEGT